jgi:biotin synthase
MDLMFRAQQVHREHHAPNTVQMSTLLSIKTGACPEDCAYCPQSVRYDTGLERERLLPVDRGARARGREGRRRHALLHGRGLALAEEARHRTSRR